MQWGRGSADGTDKQDRYVPAESGMGVGNCSAYYYEGVIGLADNVNRPDHYQSESGLECIEAIKAMTENCSGFEGYMIGNAVKYLWRHKKKGNPSQDLKKAKRYLEMLDEFNAR